MLTKEQLKQLLFEHHDIILRKELGVKRELLKIVETKIKLPHVLVLTGLRRSGKSTILRQIIKQYYNDKNFYYINFEDERFLGFEAKDFNIIYEALIELFGEQKTFFIDEIQNVEKFESFVRRFYDAGFKFYITGSNAQLLSKELGTKLTGRHIDIVVKPFSFKEYLSAKNIEFTDDAQLRTKSRVVLKNYFSEYLVKGGMPEYTLYGEPEVIRRVYEDIVIKDISVRYKVGNVILIRELYQFLITNFSKKFSYNSLKKFININSTNTIKKYVDYLEKTYFIKVINKFDYSYKKQLINDKKMFVIDNGFIQQIATKITKDKGWLLENLVFNNLNNSVFYYSNKNECDFILMADGKVAQAIQVTYDLTKENKSREINGLIEALKKFKLNKGLILTYDQEEELTIEKKRIIIKPVWKWLLK
ncbi:AAA family ATPase [archaeon CG06_land_8_20_14_3_00_37_11]|nr:MAG: AAA family ATPase [archaeon CG06_land_8_20_14_3_00_37_11]